MQPLDKMQAELDAEKYPDCWVFDINRRKYRKGKGGRGIGGSIWREHWEKVEIVGETSRSWVTVWGKKIPKKGGHGIAFSLETIERLAYIKENSYRIGEAVRRVDDCDLLRKIADLVGYEPEGDDQ